MRDIIYAFFGYMYDFIRYYKYAGWKAGNRLSVRDFKAVKIYHRLEKSLSFRNRNAQSGRGAATDLVRQLKKSGVQSDAFTFHEKVGLKVLGNYLEVSSREGGDKRDPLVEYWQKNKASAEKIGGILNTDISTLQQGKLENPEDFFSSRFSVRDFSQKNVPPEDLARAIDLALNTPSVCNRQAGFRADSQTFRSSRGNPTASIIKTVCSPLIGTNLRSLISSIGPLLQFRQHDAYPNE